MKNLIITTITLAVLMISCQEKQQLTVVGRWGATSFKVNGTETINTIPSATNVVWDFKSDGSLKFYSDAYPESSGGQNATYTANTTHVIITDSSAVTTYNIDGISTTSLQLSGDYLGYAIIMSFNK